MDIFDDKYDVAAAEEAGSKMHVKGPTGDLEYNGDDPVTITVRGFESETITKYNHTVDKKKFKGMKISDEERGAEMLSLAVLGWDGFGGKDAIECTEENKIKMFKKRPFIAQQILAFGLERSNFLPE